MAGAITDQIEKAKDRFVETRRSGDHKTYLIGFGHYKTAEALFQMHKNDMQLYKMTVSEQIEKSLLLLADLYPSPRLADAEMP